MGPGVGDGLSREVDCTDLENSVSPQFPSEVLLCLLLTRTSVTWYLASKWWKIMVGTMGIGEHPVYNKTLCYVFCDSNYGLIIQ